MDIHIHILLIGRYYKLMLLNFFLARLDTLLLAWAYSRAPCFGCTIFIYISIYTYLHIRLYTDGCTRIFVFL